MLATFMKITAPRGLHLRPSQMIEKKIRELKTEVYFIKNNMRKKIEEVKDILSLQVAQGETIGIQVFPNSKKDIQELQKTIIEINSITFS